jgi:hypothetical protein
MSSVKQGDLLKVQADALVNTVNCVGVNGTTQLRLGHSPRGRMKEKYLP